MSRRKIVGITLIVVPVLLWYLAAFGWEVTIKLLLWLPPSALVGFCMWKGIILLAEG